MPDIRAKCRQYRWTLQQDGAPSHTAKKHGKLPQKEECFIHRASDMASNSPDLNPVDYAVWGALQKQVYSNRKYTTVDQLKQAIIEKWNKLSQRFIDRSIDEWRRRLILGLFSIRVDTLDT